MIKKLGNVTVHIVDSYDELSITAGEIFANELLNKPNGVFGFATGSTPLGLYKDLIKRYNAGELDFSSITTFNLDEYYPIQKSNDQSYDYFMRTNLFSQINVNNSRINIPNGEAADVSAECKRYDKLLSESGGVDLQILGIGINGHVAFNEPSDIFSSGTHCVTLDESTIEANARFFASKDLVPAKALTMGILSIMSAKKILLIADGSKKAKAIADSLTGVISPLVPASVLQMHQNVVVVVDKTAGEMII